MGLAAKPGDWSELLEDSLEERRDRDGPMPIPPVKEKKKRARSKEAKEQEKDDKLREQVSGLDPDLIVKRIIRIISKEIEKIEEKQTKGEELNAVEAKLLDSYIRAILSAEEKLSIGKNNGKSQDVGKLSEDELKELLK